MKWLCLFLLWSEYWIIKRSINSNAMVNWCLMMMNEKCLQTFRQLSKCSRYVQSTVFYQFYSIFFVFHSLQLIHELMNRPSLGNFSTICLFPFHIYVFSIFLCFLFEYLSSILLVCLLNSFYSIYNNVRMIASEPRVKSNERERKKKNVEHFAVLFTC